MPSVPRPVVRVRVPAKINLALRVGPRREDGFHDLATVFHAVDLYDEIVASADDSISLTVTGKSAGVPSDETNLAWRAAQLLADEAGVDEGVRLRVHKRIPVAGGMAGGSADAAGALLACRTLWDLDVSDARLNGLAAQLGSDVSFAIIGGNAQGLGRGEALTPVSFEPAMHWVLVFADEGISAGAAYAEFDLTNPHPSTVAHYACEQVVHGLAFGDVRRIATELGNDLQAAAISLQPSLQVTLERGHAAGALAGIVSGSGPTCAFLCASAEHAAQVATQLPGSIVARGPARPQVCR